VRVFLPIALALTIVAGFIIYMCSFTVRFSEQAVVTTFGQVNQTGVVTQPGLRFKWPTPIQSVTLYDTRSRLLSTKSETQQTADDRQIVVQAFVVWRISDPLAFYKKNRGQGATAREQYAKAEEQLTSQLRSAMSEVSKYRLGELFSPRRGESKIPTLEADILRRVAASTSASGPDSYGVKPILVGINSIVLPEATTSEVFNRMTESRKRLAAQAESEGQARATAIRSEAQNAAKRIREFARFRADQIRNQGDQEATPYLAQLNADPELASFLALVTAMRDGFGRKLTYVMPASMAELLLLTPDALRKVRAGELPSFQHQADDRALRDAAPMSQRTAP